MTCTANCRRSRSRPRGNHTRSSSTRYIEPFCGSAGLFFDLQCWGISTMELLCAFSFNKARLFGGPDRPVKLTPATSPFPRLGWVLTGSIAAGSEYPLGNDRTGRVLQRVCSDTSRNTPQDRATSTTCPYSRHIGAVAGWRTMLGAVFPQDPACKTRSHPRNFIVAHRKKDCRTHFPGACRCQICRPDGVRSARAGKLVHPVSADRPEGK